ncbi:MAG: lipocalin family protein [Mucilaginibacter sp.]
MKKEIVATMVLVSVATLALRASTKPLETVKNVDLGKYLGKWYEIAAIPQNFEKGSIYTTAEYSMGDNGKIAIVNSAVKNGKTQITKGSAVVADGNTKAKLDVQFFWPFREKYWIIALAPDYSYAVVGHPNRKLLCILSRKPKMDNMTYNHLVVLAATKGFDIRKLVKTEQELV